MCPLIPIAPGRSHAIMLPAERSLERACLAVRDCRFQHTYRALLRHRGCHGAGAVGGSFAGQITRAQTSAFRSGSTGSPFALDHNCMLGLQAIKRQCPSSLLPSSAALVLFLTAFLSVIRACAEQQLLTSVSWSGTAAQLASSFLFPKLGRLNRLLSAFEAPLDACSEVLPAMPHSHNQ